MQSRFVGMNPFANLPDNLSMLDVLRFILQDESEIKIIRNVAK
jgi:hypothetical protein